VFATPVDVAFHLMAFKLTYTDGQEDSYDDETAWTVEGAVLKMGREAGKWTVLVSPSHWATVEVTHGDKKDADKKDADNKDADKKDADKKDADKQDKDEDD
jgi:hypothetical protein